MSVLVRKLLTDILVTLPEDAVTVVRTLSHISYQVEVPRLDWAYLLRLSRLT
jgi:hypothetical protein